MTYPVVDTVFTQGTTITSEWLNGVNDYVNESNPSDHSAANVTYDPPFTGAVATNVEAKLAQTVSVKDFGAVGDGVTDDTQAIQDAIDAALTAGQTITAEGTFKITSKIVIKGNTDFSSAIFNVYDTPAVAVEISTGSATNPTDQLYDVNIWMPLEINNMTKPTTGWSGQGVGVRAVNLHSCRVFFNRIKDFATGLLITSYSTGNVYNDYHIGALLNNKVNLALTPGDSAGWVNENNFYGGRYFFYSSEGTNVAGTRQILIPSATQIQNNNVFYKPCVEGDVPEYHIECAGSTNTFVSPRFEATTPKVIYVGNTASQGTYNVLASGIQTGNVSFSYSGTASAFNNQVQWVPDRNIINGSSNEGIWRYCNSASSANPVYSIYEATIKPETATSSQWSVRHSSQGLSGKLSTDAYFRVSLSYPFGAINLGDGAGNYTQWRYRSPNVMQTNATLYPDADNTYNIGSAGSRWGTIYAATGTINTSDENEKTEIEPLDYKEKAVALAIKARIKKFKFKDAVEKKGDKARIHFGVIAQDVKAAFEAESLNADDYGVFCSDTLEDGSVRLGVRYDELFAFIIGAIG